MFSTRIIDNIQFFRDHFNLIVRCEKELAVQMVRYFLVKLQFQRVGFIILDLRVFQMAARRHHGKNFKSLQELQLSDQADIKKSVLRQSDDRWKLY